MKRIIYLLLLFPFICFGQVPQSMSYQAMATNSEGFEIANSQISVKVSIIEETPSGLVSFVEEHTVTTDTYGMFSINIGQGNTDDDYTAVDWSKSNFLKVELDDNMDGAYSLMGVSAFNSVPYSYMAENVMNPDQLKDNLGDHTATQTLDMDSNYVSQVLAPELPLDAANKQYVDDMFAPLQEQVLMMNNSTDLYKSGLSDYLKINGEFFYFKPDLPNPSLGGYYADTLFIPEGKYFQSSHWQSTGSVNEILHRNGNIYYKDPPNENDDLKLVYYNSILYDSNDTLIFMSTLYEGWQVNTEVYGVLIDSSEYVSSIYEYLSPLTIDIYTVPNNKKLIIEYYQSSCVDNLNINTQSNLYVIEDISMIQSVSWPSGTEIIPVFYEDCSNPRLILSGHLITDNSF